VKAASGPAELLNISKMAAVGIPNTWTLEVANSSCLKACIVLKDDGKDRSRG